MTKYSQRDKRWKDIKLGYGNGTLGDFGCLLVCFSMAWEVNPNILNEVFKKNGWFEVNLVLWSIVTGYHRRMKTYNNDEVKKAIEQYRACIIETDFDTNPSNGRHFVLAIGNKKCYDPWTGTEKLLSSFPAFYGYAVYDFSKYKGEIMSDDEFLVKKSDFERMVREGSLYKEFVSAGYGSATEVKQLESDLRKSIDDKQSAINSEQEKSKRLREDFNELVAMVAISLGTVQEVPQIKVKLDEIEKELTQFDDLQRAFAELEVHSGKEKEELNAEIARLEAMLAQKNVLENASLKELIAEVIKKLKTILKIAR